MFRERIQRRIDRPLDQVEEAVDQLDLEMLRDRAQGVLALFDTPDLIDTKAFLEELAQQHFYQIALDLL